MINKKAQVSSVLGFALLVLVFIFIITSFTLIEPLKESLDTTRGSTALNCKGTTNFNQTDFDDDSSFEKLVKRPTCFVTGISMVWFIGVFLISVITWLVRNWRKLSK